MLSDSFVFIKSFITCILFHRSNEVILIFFMNGFNCANWRISARNSKREREEYRRWYIYCFQMRASISGWEKSQLHLLHPITLEIYLLWAMVSSAWKVIAKHPMKKSIESADDVSFRQSIPFIWQTQKTFKAFDAHCWNIVHLRLEQKCNLRFKLHNGIDENLQKLAAEICMS